MTLPNNNILDIIISLTLIYALLSVLVSIALEAWSQYTMARGKQLKEAIHQLLNDSLNFHYGELFYNHFLINGLRSDAKRLPQYISSNLFAEVFIDIIADQVQHDRPVKLASLDSAQGKQYDAGEAPPQRVWDRFVIAIS